MKIAILGAGALGSVIGGRLAQAGNRVTLINRNAAYLEAVRREGLILDERGRREAIQLDVAATPEGLAPVDLVIVLVKSFDTAATIARARGLVGAQTTVLSLQNGLGHEEILAEAVGAEKVIAGKTYVGGVMTAPGVITAGSIGKLTVIGELSGQITPRIEAIAAAFNAAGLSCTGSENILGAMWDKLLVNVATGALSALSGLDYGNLYDLPEIAETAQGAVAEAMAVAQGLGITLETTQPSEAWAKAAAGLPFGFKTSMLQSLERGARTEIDFINGAVVRGGKQLGIATPVNATLVACIKGRERALSPKTEASQ